MTLLGAALAESIMCVRRLPTLVLLILVAASSLWMGRSNVRAAALSSAALTANQRFVTQVYLDLLHRPVDSSALTTFAGCLDASTCSRVSIAKGLVMSAEYRSAVCRRLYSRLLMRPPSTDELNACIAQLQSGITDEGEISSLAASNEYFNTRAGNSTAAYVQALYADLLNRTATSSEVSNYAGCLDSGLCNRTDVVNDILTSTEYYSEVCSTIYRTLLHRSPGVDLSGCVTTLQNGVTDEQYTAQIAGSNEYFAGLPAGAPAAEGPFTGILGTVNTGISGTSTTSYTGSITWGDGTTSSGTLIAWNSGNFYVQGNHSYDEEGSYSIRATVYGPNGTSTSFTTSALAADAPLTGTSLRRSTSYSAAGVVATFTDADPKGTATDYSATINWGDGTASSAGVVAGTGPFTVSGAHAYSRNGIYAVRVTIIDAGGATTEVIGEDYVDTPFGGPTWAAGVRLQARAVSAGVRLSWTMRPTVSVSAYRLRRFSARRVRSDGGVLVQSSSYFDRTGHAGDHYRLQALGRRGQVLATGEAIARR